MFHAVTWEQREQTKSWTELKSSTVETVQCNLRGLQLTLGVPGSPSVCSAAAKGLEPSIINRHRCQVAISRRL